MNPYESLPQQRLWKASVQQPSELEVDFDCGRKFTFAASDAFATAGSCFAQHFARELAARGGNVLTVESRHPLEPAHQNDGYRIFSARYGNIYTVRHLREMFDQALGICEMICDFAPRQDGRWVDMLRPRAVPLGFASVDHARADRAYHLRAVRKMIETLDVFVFTLGLTEAWLNRGRGYCYPIVPGVAAGKFCAAQRVFINFSFLEIVADLQKIISMVLDINRSARILFTVSPVGLVATIEPRNVIVSTIASKSILRAAVDEVVRRYERVDYFPSYEIVTGPYSRGRYWREGLRDVTSEGVDVVMQVFVQSRLGSVVFAPKRAEVDAAVAGEVLERTLKKALDAECDEMRLDHR